MINLSFLNQRLPRIKYCLCASVCSLLVGCGGNDKSPPSQVAARVNTSEITIHQVNNAIERIAEAPSAGDEQAIAKKALEDLIDQELLVQQAINGKVDRDPKVMQSIESARRQILADAYLSRQVDAAATPSPEEVGAFYREKPDLFANRKKYEFVSFQLKKIDFTDALQKDLDTSKSANSTSSVLQNHRIEFTKENVQWNPEQVPMEMLPQVAKLQVGDILSLQRGDVIVLMQLESAIAQPVDEARAKPAIQAYLVKTKRKRLADAKVASLRAAAAIQYVGKFAGGEAKTSVPSAPAESKSSAPSDKSFLQKGLSGLKK